MKEEAETGVEAETEVEKTDEGVEAGTKLIPYRGGNAAGINVGAFGTGL